MNPDIVLKIYVFLMSISFIISFIIGYAGLKKTGFLADNFILASIYYFLLIGINMFWWGRYYWSINEFGFFGGMLLGVVYFIIGEIVLFLAFFVIRKKYLKIKN